MMGLNLGQLVTGSPPAPGALKGKTVAIDLANLMYAFYTARLSNAPSTWRTTAPELREDAIASATRGVIARILDLAELGARTVAITDGPAHPLKRATLDARDLTRSLPRLESIDYDPVLDLLDDLGVPIVHAPHDAEAQAAWMSLHGHVDVVATTDWDALAMGASVLLRGLSSAPGKTDGKRGWSIVYAPAALLELGLETREQLAAAAVLMGCDYSAGIKGIGPKKAIKHIRQAGGVLEHALAEIPSVEHDAGGDVVTLPEWRDALDALLTPAHVDVGALTWQRPSRGDLLARGQRWGPERKTLTQDEDLLIVQWRDSGLGWGRISTLLNAHRGAHLLTDAKTRRLRSISSSALQRLYCHDPRCAVRGGRDKRGRGHTPRLEYGPGPAAPEPDAGLLDTTPVTIEATQEDDPPNQSAEAWAAWVEREEVSVRNVPRHRGGVARGQDVRVVQGLRARSWAPCVAHKTRVPVLSWRRAILGGGQPCLKEG